MKRLIFCCSALMAAALVSCYEGDDLRDTYESYDRAQYLTMKEEGVSLTTAQIQVALSNPKFQSQIDVYYTDQHDGDIRSTGQKQTFVVGEADRIVGNEHQFTITGLMPETRYRFTAVYTDVSGKMIQLDERSFLTSSFEMYSNLFALTYFECSVYADFLNLVEGAEPGYLCGRERNLTVDNAERNVAVVYDGGQYAGCSETVGQLEPDTEYFLRPYVLYRGRIYYGDIEWKRTPRLEVDFTALSSEVIGSQQVHLHACAHLLHLSDSRYALPELEYGMLIAKTPGVTYTNAERHVVEPNWLGWIDYDVTDMVPTQPYYARAFVRWEDQVLTSDEISFATLKGELTGDVDSLSINGQMMPFIRVKAGTFMMGATDEQLAYARADEYPAHEVTISSDYYISAYEITRGMVNGDDDPLPARMSNADACNFAAHVGQMTGIDHVKLPTEAEWEYAARGGHLHPEQTLFAGSDDADEVAWVVDTPIYGYELPSVNRGGQKKPNALGIYDMSGNVAEWVRDAYQSRYYETSPDVDPCCTIDEWAMRGETDRTQQIVVRGGGARSEWLDMSLLDYRVSARRFTNGGEQAFGFRLVIRNN